MAEKTQKTQGPERFLFKSAGIALWGYSLMLFIMLLPPIALKMNPGASEAGPEALKTQSLITFSPLFMTIALVVTALFSSFTSTIRRPSISTTLASTP